MSEQSEKSEQSENHDVPPNPQRHPEQTVDALERKASSWPDRDEEEGVAAEDVTDNPDTGELEGLPGPSPDEPGEPAG